jgi:hypothetical protein
MELVPRVAPGRSIDWNVGEIDDPGGRSMRGHRPQSRNQNKPCKRMMISAKNVTPSISAAAIIMAVWMFPAISG